MPKGVRLSGQQIFLVLVLVISVGFCLVIGNSFRHQSDEIQMWIIRGAIAGLAALIALWMVAMLCFGFELKRTNRE